MSPSIATAMLSSIWRPRPGNRRWSSKTIRRKVFASNSGRTADEAVRLGLMRADLPDHSGSRDLDERGIGGVLDPGVGVRPSEIADRAIIGNIGAAIGPKPHVCGAVEAGNPTDERLLEGLVVGKALEIQGQRLS